MLRSTARIASIVALICVEARRYESWFVRKLDSRFQGRRVEITMLANDTRNTPAPANAHERLTWDEICQRYPDEWVVVVEIQPVDETNETDDVCSVPIEECTSVVVAHGKNRKSLSPEIKALQLHYPGLGAFFTGRLIPPAYELLVP